MPASIFTRFKALLLDKGGVALFVGIGIVDVVLLVRWALYGTT